MGDHNLDPSLRFSHDLPRRSCHLDNCDTILLVTVGKIALQTDIREPDPHGDSYAWKRPLTHFSPSTQIKTRLLKPKQANSSGKLSQWVPKKLRRAGT